jgi:glycosyltransferase involved in cell wall biosynthesis
MTAHTSKRLRMAPTPSIPGNPRVLFLIDSLGPGGAEHLMVDLLPRLQIHGIDPVVVAIQERHGNPVAIELEARGIGVTTIGIERLRERGALARVTRAIESVAPAVVHTQLEFASILGSIAARRLGIPTVSTIHTLDRPDRFSRDAARFRVMAWTLRNRADRVIAVSESARNHVLVRAGLSKAQTTTIHNGIDLTDFVANHPTARQTLRSQLGIAPDAPVLTTVAILRQPKGIDDMLDAMPALLRQHPRLVYLVAGDGPHRDSLQRHTSDLGIAESVRFMGQTSNVAGVLRAADAFVLPSHTEALPTVIIEAMAARLPVVATAVGGVGELIESGNTGLLVPPHDPARLAEAVSRVFDSPRQAEAMGIAARRAAIDRFGIDRQVARLADEYRVLVERSRPR